MVGEIDRPFDVSGSSFRHRSTLRNALYIGVGIGLLALSRALGGAPVFPQVSQAATSSCDAYAAAKFPESAFCLGGLAPDLGYEAPPSFVERADGTANIVGIVRSASNPQLRFLLRIDLAGRVVPAAGAYPPPGSPILELLPGAYLGNGGAVDPADFYYYTSSSGSLFGLDDMFGCHVALTAYGPAFQVGVGANGMNVHDGMSAAFTATTTSQAATGPALPATFTACLRNDRVIDAPLCARAAGGDAFGQSLAGQAIWLPGIGNFTVEIGATFVESSNGTAQWIGVADGDTDPNARLAVTIDFSLRNDPELAGFPPPGSPKQDLLPSSYIENGGPVDASTWHYYCNLHGTLIGMGSIAGAVIDVTNTGPAFQVGVGASGKNIGWGGAGWIDAKVIASPPGGPQWPAMAMGDLSLDLRLDCVDPTHVNVLTAAVYGAGCAGLSGVKPVLGASGTLGSGGKASLDLTHGGAGSLVVLLVGMQSAQIPIGLGCDLLIAPPVIPGNPVFTDAFGSYSTTFDVPLALVAQNWRLQAAVMSPAGLTMTNGLEVDVR